MGAWVADRLHERLGHRRSRVLVLGLTFKENVPDLRNSRVIDVVRRLEWLGHEVLVSDPLADPVEAAKEYGLALQSLDGLSEQVDLVVGAVAHEAYGSLAHADIGRLLRPAGQAADLKRVWAWTGAPFPVWTL